MRQPQRRSHISACVKVLSRSVTAQVAVSALWQCLHHAFSEPDLVLTERLKEHRGLRPFLVGLAFESGSRPARSSSLGASKAEWVPQALGS